ncbi:M1 family metallopeptidase [Luedemannella flava]|uniref:Aminopeptidase N n=1 Tax=Luedemannella flava TaxID=349316 RepID=A0ABN2LX23_9ACTN
MTPRHRPRARAPRIVAFLAAVSLAVGGCQLGGPEPQWTAPRTSAEASGPTTPPTTTPGTEPGLSSPVTDPVYPDYGNASLDVLRYDLDLAWNPTRKELTGVATLDIRPVRGLDKLRLDFSKAYKVESVQVNGAQAPHRIDGSDLVVDTRQLQPDTRVTLKVEYSGVPKPVKMPSDRGDFDEGLGLRAESDGSAWTMQEPYGASTWYPANDHPSDEAMYDIRVTVPRGWSGIASGELVDTKQNGDTTTFVWRSSDPVASYLTTLAVGKYTKVTDTGPRGMPITYWLRTGHDEGMRPVFERTPEIIAWLEKRYGPYPFASAGIVSVSSTSAMETQQMITLGGDLVDEMQGSEVEKREYLAEVIAHELAHQWFGNAVTPRDWRSVWLSEGMAMYIEGEWLIADGFADRDKWIEWLREADRESRRVAGPPGKWKADHFAENNIYVGPALMLYEFRKRIGATAVDKLLRDWVQTQRNQPVDRESFTAFVKLRHPDLVPVLDEWLDSPTTPTGT